MFIQGGPEENTIFLIAILAGKQKVFLRISLFNMGWSFNGLASQQVPCSCSIVMSEV